MIDIHVKQEIGCSSIYSNGSVLHLFLSVIVFLDFYEYYSNSFPKFCHTLGALNDYDGVGCRLVSTMYSSSCLVDRRQFAISFGASKLVP